jgi:methylenetetrahydrofolate dehydrogenase (NADP+)/methenyltetrahydrofolate cyclohydrolase
VGQLRNQGKNLVIAAILFSEDQGSVLYTRLKQEAAERVGIGYQVHTFSMTDDVAQITATLEELNQDQTITGIIIQKPWRQTWARVTGQSDREAFQQWWSQLVSRIDEAKDVDGLHPKTLAAVQHHTWQKEGRVLPATAQAVLDILKISHQLRRDSRIVILGKSDILGKPLFYELSNQGYQVEMIGSAELSQRMSAGKALLDSDVVISATGRKHLITGGMLQSGVTVIDVGEPFPDVEMQSVKDKAAFITPVPGGVGPMTVVSLLANAVKLVHSLSDI